MRLATCSVYRYTASYKLLFALLPMIAMIVGCNEDIPLGPEHSAVILEAEATVTRALSAPYDIAEGDVVRALVSYVPIHGDGVASGVKVMVISAVAISAASVA